VSFTHLLASPRRRYRGLGSGVAYRRSPPFPAARLRKLHRLTSGNKDATASGSSPASGSPGSFDSTDVVDKLGDLAARAGLRRISMLAWRDLDDPEAGGSEVHASTVASLWGQAGIEVTMRTSYAPGRPQVAWRDGYRVIRKAGRYMVFPRAAFSEMMGWHGARDGLVEIWNGMPFLSAVWARGPRVTWLHHVHDSMWQMTLPPRLAAVGSTIESRIAPPLYRGIPIITLSESSKRELVEKLRFKPNHITVVPPGVNPRFSPAGEKSPTPLVVAVGRLVPVKRFHLLVDALTELKPRHPDLEAVIVGEGYLRDELERQVREAGAEQWLRLPGHVDDDELISLYRRAWAVASASAHEGWGMTLTEAAACGTPAVATRIAGHADAVAEGSSGLLVDDRHGLAPALEQVIGDERVRARLSAGALEHAARFTWGATAYGTLEVLAEEALRRRSST
jgi:glycosyltransferase involved in cell wall biosynthesis